MGWKVFPPSMSSHTIPRYSCHPFSVHFHLPPFPHLISIFFGGGSHFTAPFLFLKAKRLHVAWVGMSNGNSMSWIHMLLQPSWAWWEKRTEDQACGFCLSLQPYTCDLLWSATLNHRGSRFRKTFTFEEPPTYLAMVAEAYLEGGAYRLRQHCMSPLFFSAHIPPQVGIITMNKYNKIVPHLAWRFWMH